MLLAQAGMPPLLALLQLYILFSCGFLLLVAVSLVAISQCLHRPNIVLFCISFICGLINVINGIVAFAVATIFHEMTGYSSTVIAVNMIFSILAGLSFRVAWNRFE